MPAALDNTVAALERLSSGAAGGYDAVEDRRRRRPPRIDLRSEDRILHPVPRQKLVATARDVIRNYCTAAWMVRCHLDYVSRFTFQSRTGDDALDAAIEAAIWRASQRNAFDATGRFGLAKALRISEARRVLDGDIWWTKLASGRVQMVESDRVRMPAGGFPIEAGVATADLVNWIHGVEVSEGGRIRNICICRRRRDSVGGYEFERIVPSKNVWQHACFDANYRVDQVRGISPLAPALNTLRDIYEGIDLAMAKAKVAQMFGLVFFKQKMEAAEGWAVNRSTEFTDDAVSGSGTDPDADNDGLDDATGEPAPDTDRYEVDPGEGPFKIELERGDDAKFLTTNTPEGELLDFMKFTTDLSLKALDIPYSFYDTSAANYYGRKADIQQYENSARAKRDDNGELLDSWTFWRLQLMVLDGSLILPGAMTVNDLSWDWVPGGMPWVDKLRDMKADQMAIEMGQDSVVRAARRNGNDAREIAVEQMDHEAWLIAERAKRGLPPMADPGAGAKPGVSDPSKADDNA